MIVVEVTGLKLWYLITTDLYQGRNGQAERRSCADVARQSEHVEANSHPSPPGMATEFELELAHPFSLTRAARLVC